MDLSTILPLLGQTLLGGGTSGRSQGAGVPPSKLGGGSATPAVEAIGSPSGAFPDATDPGSTALSPTGAPSGALAWLAHVLQMNQGVADTTGINPLALGFGATQGSPVSADAALAAPQRGITLHDLFGPRQPVSWLPPMHVDLGANPIPIGRDQTDPLAWLRVYGRF
jgi:hypothetical protein